MAMDTSSLNSFTYQVFLSFRGPDARTTFADHLYRSLSRIVVVFRDNEEIERGTNIMSELESAIKNSEMSVIVFSENYVTSKACLTEVTSIFEHSKNCRHTILPVFYHVEPADIKKQARELAAANSSDKKQEAWSNAVVEVSKLAGMHLKKGHQHETEFIKEVVEMVEHMLTPSAQYNGPHLIGMRSRVEKIEMWLRSRNQTDNDGILVIRGMAGVGKTTAANFVYQENRSRFDVSVFFENIKLEASKNSEYVSKMQRKLLSNLIRRKVDKAWDRDMIMTRIKHGLSNKRILLVLDDVDEVEQSEEILIIRNWMTLGSKIIITTTREDLSVDQVGTYKEHRVENLSYDQSVELFNWHAFGNNLPSTEFNEMSASFARICQGHPLALRVLGASVSGKSRSIWSSTLKSLEERLDEKVLGKLKLSYESLQLNSDRNLFLDIACFFVGKKRNKTISILDGCGYFTELGIQKLCDRNLITIRDGKLGMHQLLQYMAKQFVREESLYPEDRTRIWRYTESLHVLTSQNKETGNIEGLVLDRSILKSTVKTSASNTWMSYFVRNDDEETVETTGFQNMSKLRLLKLKNVQPFGNYNVFPTNIRWLSWRWCNFKSLPTGFPPKNIISFELRNNSLEQVWRETKALGSLKNLNLSYSSKLKKTPNVSRIPDLEELTLRGCKSLVEVDESIVHSERLKVLNLEDCTSLRKLPKDIGFVRSLEELILSGCSNLEGAADELEKMELRELYLDRTILHKVLNSSTSSLSTSTSTRSDDDDESNSIFNYFLRVAKRPRRNPEISWVSLPAKYLVTLSMRSCNLCDSDFPASLPPFPVLRYLHLGGNLISKLPQCIRNLKGLHTLDLSWSPRLRQIEWPSLELEKLDLTECRLLEEITRESGSKNAPKLISHGACMSLNYVQNSFEIHPVQQLVAEFLEYFGLSHLEPIANMEVSIVNCIVWSRKRLPIQVLFELQFMYMSYYPGKEVPNWFTNKTSGSTISFIMPSTSSQLRGMNVCVVYTHAPGIIDMTIPLHLYIRNKTKSNEEKYIPRCYGVPEEDKDMVWLFHWPEEVCYALFEERDEIELSFGLDVPGEIKECGIQFLHHLSEDQESDSMSC